MTNLEYPLPYDDTDSNIERTLRRDELIDDYLDQRSLTYEELVEQLEREGGELTFGYSEQLEELRASYHADAAVEFSEQQSSEGYHHGILTEGAFLVPLANPSYQPSLYRPHLCVAIEDIDGLVDCLLFPVIDRGGVLEVQGLRVLE